MVSKGALVVGLVALLSLPAAGAAAPNGSVHCAISGGSPVVDVAVQATGTVSAVRVFYRYEDGRDAYADMVPLAGRYTARLPKSPLGAGGLSYRIVADSSFTTSTGMPVLSTQLVAEAMGCGPTLRAPTPMAVPVQLAPLPVVGDNPITPDIITPPILPPGPPTGGDPRSPAR